MDDANDCLAESNAVAKARLQVDTKKWFLTKCMPKLYGERISSRKDGRPLIEDKPVDNLATAGWIALILSKAGADLQDKAKEEEGN